MRERLMGRLSSIDKKTATLLAISILVMLYIGIKNPSKFFSLYNFQSMMRQMCELGIYAMAMFVVIVAGGLNLSIVAVANLSAICGGVIMQGIVLGNVITDPTMRIVIGAIVALLVGIIAGAINGYFVAGLGLTAVLVTSATMQFFEGVALMVTQGKSIMGAPKTILALGAGNMLGSIPYLLILLIICYTISILFFNYTSMGELFRLHGANNIANKYSGNNNYKIQMISYMLSGFFSAIAGIVSYSRMGVLRSDYGASYRDTALLVILLGGAMVSGGGGKILHMLISLFCLQILSSGLVLIDVSSYVREIVWGILLLFVLINNTPVFQEKWSRFKKSLLPGRNNVAENKSVEN